MKRMVVVLAVAVCLMLSAADMASARIARVAKTFNFIEFNASGNLPMGQYDRIGAGDYEIPFVNSVGRYFDLDADEVYEDTWSLGFKYGVLKGDHLTYSIGFQYTNVKHKDTFYVDDLIHMYDDSYDFPKIQLYDFSFNVNTYFTNPNVAPFSPYVGVSGNLGFLHQNVKGFDAANKAVVSLGLNFGADLTVWKNPDNKSFVTISSVNQFQLLASSERPKYLQIGGALKYYFRY